MHNPGSFLRFSDWWNSKIAMLVGWSYFFALLFQQDFRSFITLLPGIILWLFSTAAFGYYMNDCFDIDVDFKAKKSNSASKHSITKRTTVLVLLGSVSLISSLFLLWSQTAFCLLVIAQLLLFFLYSIPPFRWKEVLYLDIVTDSIYAQVIPVSMMALVALANYSQPVQPLQFVIVGVVGLWALVSGLRNILEHQLADLHNDRISGVSNTVQHLGEDRVSWFLSSRLIPIEWSLFGLIIILSGFLIPSLVLLTAVFILILGFTTPIAEGIIEKTRPFRSGSRLLEPRLIYEFWFPIVCIVVLVLLDWKFLFLGIVHLILFRNWVVVLAGDFVGNVVYYQASDVFWHRGTLKFYYEGKTVYGLTKGIANRIITSLWAMLVGLSYRILHVIYFKGFLELWIAFRLLVNYFAYQFKFRVLGDKEERIRWKNRNGGNR